MDDASSFTNNPFAVLPKNRFKTKEAAALPKKQEKKSRAEPGDDEAENRLFLETVCRAPAVKKDAAVSAAPFRLEDQRAFQAVRGKKNSGAKKSLAAPQRTTTAPAEPVAPSRAPDAAPDAEADAFALVMRGVRPLSGKGREIAPPAPPVPAIPHADTTMQDFLDGKLEFALSLTGEYLEGHVVGLDEITMNKLRAGQYSPEAHLDLHGLNALQAFQALVGFFRGAWYKGMRTVLVVPGRGRNSMNGIGILREKLQSWLTQEPFKRVVLAFCTARPVDGGPGSVYVLLRKMRKKGKICWERMPADPDLF